MVRHTELKPSQFNVIERPAKSDLLVFNTLSGAMRRYSGDAATIADALVSGHNISDFPSFASQMVSDGFLVSQNTCEHTRASELRQRHSYDETRLHIVILPTEKCNFRCTYCYETFAKGKMKPVVQNSLIQFIERQASNLTSLSISWFGGEPLVASDVINSILLRANSICRTHNIYLRSDMTTNAFLLTLPKAKELISLGVADYQITLDGSAKHHNTSRPLANGSPTFDTIVANLRDIKNSDLDFHVRLRVNFSPSNLHSMEIFLEELSADFSHDSRFSVHFNPVGDWGGPHEGNIEVCDEHTGSAEEHRLMATALKNGFHLGAWKSALKHHGSVCYAADPRSIVIGSDGMLYKCTVAFDEQMNQIGTINEDGTLTIDQQKTDFWIRSGEEVDEGCQVCSFRPSCQGNLCPLERLKNNQKVCVPFKFDGGARLSLLAQEAQLAIPK